MESQFGELIGKGIGSYLSGSGAGAEAGTASTASSSGGMSGLGMAGIIAAAIAAQHAMSKDTETEVEGVKTKDAFSGHFATEPWLAYLHDIYGMDPTAGEYFDAAVKNKDYGLAMKRAPAMLDYWANPLDTWQSSIIKAGTGKETGKWQILDKVFDLGLFGEKEK